MKSVLTKKNKLMISGETRRCCKVRRILRYHVPNKLLSPEKFAHHVLVLFFPFGDEKKFLLSGFAPIYQNKLQKERVQDVVSINKRKFKPYGDLVDQAFLNFNENFISNQDTHSQIENDEHQLQDIPMKLIEKKIQKNFCTSQLHATNITR